MMTLPKARIFYIKWRLKPLQHTFASFRLANAMFVWVGPFEIGWRMPWLKGPAKQIYGVDL